MDTTENSNGLSLNFTKLNTLIIKYTVKHNKQTSTNDIIDITAVNFANYEYLLADFEVKMFPA